MFPVVFPLVGDSIQSARSDLLPPPLDPPFLQAAEPTRHAPANTTIDNLGIILDIEIMVTLKRRGILTKHGGGLKKPPKESRESHCLQGSILRLFERIGIDSLVSLAVV